MAEKNRLLEEAMKAMEEKYGDIDSLIEQKYRQYVLEQQMRMKSGKKNANGSSWLENMSEMDRRAEEKRMIMKIREAEHAKRRADKLEAERKAEAEAAEKLRQDLSNADKDSDDDGTGSVKTKRHRAKVEKLKLKGDHLDTPTKRAQERREAARIRKSLSASQSVEFTGDLSDGPLSLLANTFLDTKPISQKYMDIKAIGLQNSYVPYRPLPHYSNSIPYLLYKYCHPVV